LQSALRQLSRSKPLSSIEHEQQRGDGEAKAAGASHKMLAICTSTTDSEQVAVEYRARAAARQWRGAGGWRVTQDGCDQHPQPRVRASCRRAKCTSSSKAMERPRRLAHHARWSRSASADERSSRLLSSIEHEQEQGNGEAKVVVAPRNVVGIGASGPEQEQTEPEPSAIEQRARAAARQRWNGGGWRVTQDGCDQH